MLGEKDTRDPRFDFKKFLREAPPGLEAEITPEKMRERYDAAHVALAKVRSVVADAHPDVFVVISNAHGVHPEDNQPVFGVLRSETVPVGRRTEGNASDAYRVGAAPRKREIVENPGHPELANHLIASLVDRGFDVACTDRIKEGSTIDGAFSFAYDYLFPSESDVPVVMFFLSRYLPFQATPGRCFELGAALRGVIEEWDSDARVGLIASGGLSHQVVDEEFDRGVIKALESGDKKHLVSLSRERLNKSPGTPETLNWVTVASAMAPQNMTLVDYLPCYRSLAGTGHGLTFGYWPGAN